MPLYQFINTETGEEFELMLKLAEREPYLVENPHIKQVLTGSAFIDSHKLGIKKPDEGFREILRKVKKDSRQDINTFS